MTRSARTFPQSDPRQAKKTLDGVVCGSSIIVIEHTRVGRSLGRHQVSVFAQHPTAAGCRPRDQSVPSYDVTSAAYWIWLMTSPGTALDDRSLMAQIALGSSFGVRSSLRRPLVSCSVSVSCV
jgi:hypothetical protein